ncbi:hypothetical protein N7467_005990 [Penicillium canescens]|nr:hypothetical protein N7467_005990 [Penicillium canescens]
MATTGYFIDRDWNYREILLGFEPLHRTHSGINLSTSLGLAKNITIIRVPCIAYIKANLKNETAERNWSDVQFQSAYARQQNREIDDDYDWHQGYRQSFKEYVRPYQQRLVNSQTSSQEQASARPTEVSAIKYVDDLDPVSDNEEDMILIQEQPTAHGLSERVAGKRRRSMASEVEEEAQQAAQSDEAEIPLPKQPNTQQRISGRNRKRTRREDDDFVHY